MGAFARRGSTSLLCPCSTGEAFRAPPLLCSIADERCPREPGRRREREPTPDPNGWLAIGTSARDPSAVFATSSRAHLRVVFLND